MFFTHSMGFFALKILSFAEQKFNFIVDPLKFSISSGWNIIKESIKNKAIELCEFRSSKF